MMADYRAYCDHHPDFFSTEICGKRSSYVIAHNGIESDDALRETIESSTVFVPDYVCLPLSIFNKIYHSSGKPPFVKIFGQRVRVIPINIDENFIILRGNKFQNCGNMCFVAIDDESVFKSIPAEKDVLVTQYRVNVHKFPFPAIVTCHRYGSSKIVIVNDHERFVKLRDVFSIVDDGNRIAMDLPKDAVHLLPDLPVDLVFFGARV